MLQKNENQQFNLVVSTKGTVIGADTSKFKLTYAPVNNPLNETVVDGSFAEAVKQIADADKHVIKVTVSAFAGSRILRYDPSDSANTIQEGDVIEYATGKYALVLKLVNGKAYLKTPLKANVSAGTEIKQAGNTGIYTTPTFSIDTAGDYLVRITAYDYGIIAEERVVINAVEHSTYDTDAPDGVGIVY